MQSQNLYAGLFFLFALSFISCGKSIPKEAQSDQIFQSVYHQVRLGDGVPLNLNISLRWKINDPALFYSQYISADTFNKAVLYPRTQEAVKKISNDFASVDSVFSEQRVEYIATVKQSIIEQVGEQGVTMKEVILSEITFPATYTSAMEQVGLQKQELERIRQQNIVDIEKADAQKKKAAADGEVSIAKATAEGELQKIQAKTEQSRRKIELAKAETEAQKDRKMAKAEAERVRLLANAERDKVRSLKAVDAQHKRDLMQIEVDKQLKMDKVELTKQIDFAQICTQNPVYASFLVNKELASNVEIAVLPQGNDGNVLGTFLQQNKLPSGN